MSQWSPLVQNCCLSLPVWGATSPQGQWLSSPNLLPEVQKAPGELLVPVLWWKLGSPGSATTRSCPQPGGSPHISQGKQDSSLVKTPSSGDPNRWGSKARRVKEELAGPAYGVVTSEPTCGINTGEIDSWPRDARKKKSRGFISRLHSQDWQRSPWRTRMQAPCHTCPWLSPPAKLLTLHNMELPGTYLYINC